MSGDADSNLSGYHTHCELQEYAGATFAGGHGVHGFGQIVNGDLMSESDALFSQNSIIVRDQNLFTVNVSDLYAIVNRVAVVDVHHSPRQTQS